MRSYGEKVRDVMDTRHYHIEARNLPGVWPTQFMVWGHGVRWPLPVAVFDTEHEARLYVKQAEDFLHCEEEG